MADALTALKAAKGYLLNAKIDLETGRPRATAIKTIEGGLCVVRAAIALPPLDAKEWTLSPALPEVPAGNMRSLIVAVKGKYGKDFTMAAYYLNAYPLEYEECICLSEEAHGEADGCATTGWYYDNSNFEYENCFWKVEGEIVAWRDLPKFDFSALTASPAHET